jgi:aminoglycoside phosphotransferase (APT) family kinase protein
MKNMDNEIHHIADNLITYLRGELNDPKIGYDSPLTQLHGGQETYTCRFKLKGVPEELSKPLVLRLYPRFYGTGDAVWESTVQNVLADCGFPVPRVFFTCTDMSILGGAFFIMAYLPGELMMTAPIETIPELLGKTHAALHKIDPEPLIRSLKEGGIQENAYGLSNRLDWLFRKASKLPWLRDGADWLATRRPSDPDSLAVCHGDFHPLNILIDEGRVTGVLDWGGFIIADPVYDVGNTIMLTTIPIKQLGDTADMKFSAVDWDIAAQLYLDAYRSVRPLDGKHLDYYRVRRCVFALIQGVEGQVIWQHPLIVKDLVEYIYKITSVRIKMPE